MEYSTRVYYCAKDQSRAVNGIHISHWIDPFTTTVWILCLLTLLGIPFLGSILVSKSILESLLVVIGTIGVVLRQYTKIVNKKLLIFGVFLGFFLCSFYENQITSLAIVQLPPKTIGSLNELISKGYKILIYEEDDIAKFLYDFKVRQMEAAFNKSWYVIGSKYEYFDKNNDTMVKLLVGTNGTAKYASLTNTMYLQYSLTDTTEQTREETGCADYNCHSIPDEIGKSQYYWVVNAKNKHWIEKSIDYMQSAGLQQQWNNWEEWFQTLQQISYERLLKKKGIWLGESLIQKPTLGPGLIRVQELGSFIILVLILLLSSILLLVVEIVKNRLNITKVTVLTSLQVGLESVKVNFRMSCFHNIWRMNKADNVA
ncbi:unnamed protein product [Orchesella dallaii]|uniref:Uncharacterized protein n=1 Tax=Orchesella dallaii TaxID=48710 RepID=A0ABP1QJ48_9HEXA